MKQTIATALTKARLRGIKIHVQEKEYLPLIEEYSDTLKNFEPRVIEQAILRLLNDPETEWFPRVNLILDIAKEITKNERESRAITSKSSEESEGVPCPDYIKEKMKNLVSSKGI